jgi:probable HAF family extracellular repeat protein
MPITFNTFDDPSALTGTTYAYGINDTGQIVGWYYDGSGNGGNHGFLLSGGTYTTLDYPGAISPHGTSATWAYGINDLGQIVGTTWQGANSFLLPCNHRAEYAAARWHHRRHDMSN